MMMMMNCRKEHSLYISSDDVVYCDNCPLMQSQDMLEEKKRKELLKVYYKRKKEGRVYFGNKRY